MTLEDKLLERLVALYKLNGFNIQKVLDNPEFAKLSLEKKIQFIENNKESLSSTPVFNNKYIKGSAIGGALGLAGSMYVNSLIQGHGANPLSLAVGLGAVGGAAMGSIGGYFAGKNDLKRDALTQKMVADKDYVGSLSVRNIDGMGRPTYAAAGNKYVEQIQGFGEKLLGDFGPRFENNLREALKTYRADQAQTNQV